MDRIEKMYDPDISHLYEYCGYRFERTEHLRVALTHSSYSNEHGKKNGYECNERLEFLGDSVLSILVSEYLFFKYPKLPEGELTKTRAAVVCESTLYILAEQIHLGDFLLLGKGEEQNNGRHRKSILADAFEAFLAALYIDGGRKQAEKFLYKLIIPQIEKQLSPMHSTDYKTLLQQFVQETPGEQLTYVLTDETGPNHDKVFYIDAVLGSNVVGSGSGKTKRAAEQAAARAALLLFGVIKERE